MDRKKIILIFSILLLAILGIFLVFSFNGKKLETAQFDSIKMSYYSNTEIVLDKNKSSVDYYFEVLSDKDDSLYNISLVKENNTNTSDEKIKISLIKNGEYIVGDENSGESISSSRLSELLSNQSTNINNKDIYVLKIWSEEEVIDGNFKVSVKVEEVKKTDDKMVRIKLDADGGKLSVSEVSVEKNGTYGALPTPVKDGYNFIGWYSKKENGELIAKETRYSSVRADILYAMYVEKVVIKPNIDITNKVETPNTQPSNDNTTLPPVVDSKKEYTITFITNGGSEIKPITLLEGTKIENVSNPIREGYDFAGWDVSLPQEMPANNLVLNALWKAKTYNVNLKFSEKLNVNKPVVYDNTYGTLPDVSKDGYTFIGWFTEENGGVQVKGDDIVKITSDITLYARLEANKYNVKFSSDTSDVIEDIEVTYDQMYGDLPVVSKNGYTFDGWYFDKYYNEKVNSTDIVKITSDIILFARFVANRYTITFDFGYDMLNKDIYYGEQYGELPVASKDGYDFVGWFTAGADGVQITSDSVYEFATNQILYARYEAKKLNVSFETFGGSIHEKIQVTYDDIYGELPTPEKTGYTFGGWFFDNEFKNIVSGLDTVKVLEDITLYAKFTANTYTLTMDFNFDVGATMNKDITYDQAYGELVQPDRYGYTFMGWYTAQSGGELITEDTVVKVTSNLTIYARWNQSGVLKLSGNTKQSRLPLEYQELEYIESTGTQYIDTGVLAGSNVKIEIDGVFKYIEGKTYVTGGRDDFDTNRIALFSNSNYFDFQFGTKGVGYDNVSNTRDDVRKLISFSKSGVYINNELKVDGTDQEFTSSCNIYLFAVNKGEEIQYGSGTQLYNYKIYVDGVLILDFVPAYRKSDAEVGLYDLVNDKFYSNSGTGRFKSGSFVNSFTQTSTTPSSVTSVGEKTKNFFNGELEQGTVNVYNGNLVDSEYRIRTKKIKLQKGKTYVRSFNSKRYQYRNTTIYNSDGTFSRNTIDLPISLTGDEEYLIDIYSFIGDNILIDADYIFDLNLQIEEGVTPTEYEPYGYKIPINVTGKNIADPQYVYDYVTGMQAFNGNTLTKTEIDENGREKFVIYSGSGYVGANAMDGYYNYRRIFNGIFKESTQYTISFKFYLTAANNALNLFVRYTDGSYESLENTQSFVPYQIYDYSFTSKANKTIDFIGVEYRDGFTVIFMDTLQIEEGTQATSYEPFVRKDVVKQSKNLFDESKYDEVSEYKKIGNNTYTSAEILLKPNTTYRVSIKRYNGHTGSNTGYLLISDHSGINGNTWTSIEHMSSPNTSNVDYVYTTGDNGKLYIGYHVGSGYTDDILANVWKNTDVQIEEGTEATEYEPYYKHVNEIYLDEPLRCVDGICDYIDFETKKVIRRIGVWKFDGNTTWRNADNGLSNTFRASASISDFKSTTIISNRFTPIISGTSNNDTENVQISGDYIYFRVERNKLISNDLTGFIEFIEEHPTEVLYQLSEEFTEDVIIPDIPFGNGYVVNFGTLVKPSIK